MRLKQTKQEQDERVEQLLKDLGLLNVGNTPVGSAMQKTISGGERKRTSIGVELITDPSIIILDEPTSGLDSFKSLQMIKLLKTIARQGKTVISSIHSPNSEGFMMFDKLMLLADGYIVYQGQAKLSHEYFSQIGFQCPKYKNPADYYMKEFSVNYPKSEADENKIAHLRDSYNSRMADSVKNENFNIQLIHPEIDLNVERISFWPQLTLLIARDVRKIQRDPKFFRARFLQNLYVSLLLIMIFHTKPDLNYRNNQTSLLGVLYYICQNQTISNCTAALLIFNAERRVFLREFYKIYEVIVVQMKQEPENFFGFFFALLNLTFYASSLGYLFGTIFTSPGSSNLVSSQILMPLNIQNPKTLSVV